MIPRPASVDPHVVPQLATGLVPSHWQNQQPPGPMTLASDMMRRCAELRDTCERAGHPLAQKIHEADRWVAATALYLDIELVSDDLVLAGVQGIRLLGR